MPKVPSSISGIGLWQPFGEKNEEHGDVSLNLLEGTSRVILENITLQK